MNLPHHIHSKPPSGLSWRDKWLRKLGLVKIYKWEFWPFWIFYIPLYFYWFFLSIRARSFIFFSAANPLMELGGFSSYSKYKVLEEIPSTYLPKTRYVPADISPQNLQALLNFANLDFPLIAKPDRGERGKGVSKIESLDHLKEYLSQQGQSVILQEYIDYPIELGLMYYRIPGEEKGHITSVVRKKFLSITGDGKRNIQELILDHPRYYLFIKHLKDSYPHFMNEVLSAGEEKVLEPIGNHARGTIFQDAREIIRPELVDLFDEISQNIPGFYFGRYDLKVPTLEELYQGKNIKIMELNGANSEPAHIYDPSMALWKAYQDLFKHWRLLYRVSVANRARGVDYTHPRYALNRVIRHLRTGD